MEIQRSGNTNYMANYRDIIFNSVDEYTRANDNKPVEFNFSSSLKSCNPKLSIIPSYIFPRNVNKNNYSNLYPTHTHTHIRFSLLNFTRILSIFYQTSKMKRAMCKHVPLQIRTRISIKNLSRYHGTIRFEKHVHIRAMEQYEMYFETDRAFLFHISSPFHLLVRPINRGRFLSLSRH